MEALADGEALGDAEDDRDGDGEAEADGDADGEALEDSDGTASVPTVMVTASASTTLPFGSVPYARIVNVPGRILDQSRDHGGAPSAVPICTPLTVNRTDRIFLPPFCLAETEIVRGPAYTAPAAGDVIISGIEARLAAARAASGQG